MGQAGFMLLGAYGFAIATIAGWPLWAAVLIAIAAATIFALILGIPTLKLRGDYLAIVTIAAAEIVRLVGRSTALTELTGASSGLRGNQYKDTFQDASPFDDGTWALGPFEYAVNASNSWWIRIVGWLVVALACLLVWLLIRSPWGRVLKGIREDEDAVRSLGKNVYSYKMQALIMGGVIGTFAGMILALGTANVQPDNFSRDLTFYILTGLVLGGLAKVTGSIVGPMLFWALYAFLDSFLRELVSGQPVRWGGTTIIDSTQVGPVVFMFMGALLVLLMWVRPQGLFGNLKEMAFDGR